MNLPAAFKKPEKNKQAESVQPKVPSFQNAKGQPGAQVPSPALSAQVPSPALNSSQHSASVAQGVPPAAAEKTQADKASQPVVGPKPGSEAPTAAGASQQSLPAQTQAPKEKAVVFSKPNQVQEIMKEVDRLKLSVLVRYSRTGKAVRAVFSGFSMANGLVTLSGISAAGEKLIGRSIALKIEFILLSKKIVFVSEVVSRAAGKVVLKMPDKVVAIERRINVRFKVPSSCSAFIEFPDRRFDLLDEGAPYFPPGLVSSARNSAFLRIDDVSLGGVAGFTRYPAVSGSIKIGDEQQNAILYFPESYPVSLPVSVRWVKKTIVTDNDKKFEEFRKQVCRLTHGSVQENNIIVKESYSRVGVQFADVSKELDTLLRAFIRRVQQAESV